MLELQRQGCHNINFVTPSHVVPQFLEALAIAAERGLRLPLVYNCGGYERVSALKLLDGIVDIYMPDFKFWDPQVAENLCQAADYPERARNALREMHRQVGDLELDAQGIARRGLLIRHLVMPRGLAGTRGVLHFIATELSRNSYVNVMDQYRPCGEAVGRADIGRTLTSAEYEEALHIAQEEGLKRLDERTWRRLLRW
jgi:putative pyruvate formate lyase activating enzyme